MHDTRYCGNRFILLNIIDESTRECLAIEIDRSLLAQHSVRVMKQLKTERESWKKVRVDNGPELVSSIFADWHEEHGMKVAYLQKGKPQQNEFAERFEGLFRYEFLV